MANFFSFPDLCNRFTYRSLGSTNNAYERSVEHRNFVKILRFLSLVCERSRREETFSLRSNLMLGNTMHLLVDSVSSNVDQPVPMDALNCVRLALECWPRIDVVIFKLKKSYESGLNVSVPTPQVTHHISCSFIADCAAGQRVSWGFA